MAPRTASVTRRRLATLVLAPLLALTALVGAAAPAQAAPGVELVVSDDNPQPGESFTLTWTATDDTPRLFASGDWSGDKALPSGSEVLSFDEPGEHRFHLLAMNADAIAAPATVVVLVEERITPEPVTFDGCIVIIPEDEGVRYLVDFGGDLLEPLDAGRYDLTDFEAPGDVARFVALPSSDVRFTEDATTAWSTTVGRDCESVPLELVEATATCGTVRFTSVSDLPVLVLFGDADEDGPDGDRELEPGESVAVTTERDEVDFVAYALDVLRPQAGTVAVPQDCGAGAGSGADHPTVAPAAGLGDGPRAE